MVGGGVGVGVAMVEVQQKIQSRLEIKKSEDGVVERDKNLKY